MWNFLKSMFGFLFESTDGLYLGDPRDYGSMGPDPEDS
jgi:hypothetical protein